MCSVPICALPAPISDWKQQNRCLNTHDPLAFRISNPIPDLYNAATTPKTPTTPTAPAARAPDTLTAPPGVAGAAAAEPAAALEAAALSVVVLVLVLVALAVLLDVPVSVALRSPALPVIL